MRNPREGLRPVSEHNRLLALDVTSSESIAAALDAAGPFSSKVTWR